MFYFSPLEMPSMLGLSIIVGQAFTCTFRIVPDFSKKRNRCFDKLSMRFLYICDFLVSSINLRTIYFFMAAFKRLSASTGVGSTSYAMAR